MISKPSFIASAQRTHASNQNRLSEELRQMGEMRADTVQLDADLTRGAAGAFILIGAWRDHFVVLPAKKGIGARLSKHLRAERYDVAGARDFALKHVVRCTIDLMLRHAGTPFAAQAGAQFVSLSPTPTCMVLVGDAPSCAFPRGLALRPFIAAAEVSGPHWAA
jgi:hypothetical protein